jgi:transposase
MEDGMSIRHAAKHFNIPKSTKGDIIGGKHELHVPNGRPPHMPKAIEDKILDAVKMAARRDIGLTRQQILNRTIVPTKRMTICGGFPNFKAGKGL